MRKKIAYDTQKNQLYDAEQNISQGRKFKSQDEIQKYVDRIVASRWWKSRDTVEEVEVRTTNRVYGEGNRVDGKRGWINLPRGLWRTHYVLHELCHVMIGSPPWHGPAFVARELEITRWKQGIKVYEKLKSECDKRGVIYA